MSFVVQPEWSVRPWQKKKRIKFDWCATIPATGVRKNHKSLIVDDAIRLKFVYERSIALNLSG